MAYRKSIVVSLILLTALSGCFIETGGVPNVAYNGNVSENGSEFSMDGYVEITGNNREDTYENISLELYDRNGSLIYEENLGTIDRRNESLPVSVSLSTIPEYVIFNSPDVWDGNAQVAYYVRSQSSSTGYRWEDASSKDELPVEPSG